jgi:hypothetical protein
MQMWSSYWRYIMWYARVPISFSTAFGVSIPRSLLKKVGVFLHASYLVAMPRRFPCKSMLVERVSGLMSLMCDVKR